MSPYLYMLFLACTPVSEVRGAIPYGILAGLPVWQVFLLSVLANIAIVPILFLFLRFASFRNLIFKILGERIKQKVDKNRERFETYGALALIPFVAVPLPLTGAYTAVLIAEFMGWSRIKSGIAISMGIVIASAIVLLAGLGINSI